MTTFLDLFETIQKGDFGLTEQAIYWSIKAGGKFVPVWGGNQEHITIDRLISENGRTKYGYPVTIFNGEGIIISLDGSAGSMTYKISQRFALNHHAGFCKLKKEAKELIIPEFFALFYQKQLQEESISEGSKTLTLKQIYSMDFEIPSYEVQKSVMSKIQPILFRKRQIIEMLNEIGATKNKTLAHGYRIYQAKDVPISEITDYIGGNSGLTEREIYQKSQVDGQRYVVLSSSTEKETRLGEVPVCNINGKNLKIFEDKEGLLVIRNGKAGTTIFLEKGKYTTTDHAYILFLKDACKYQVSLKWLMIQYRNTFLEYSSSADNGTWNMTGFFKKVTIDVPSLKEQMEIVDKYECFEKLEWSINSIKTKIDSLFMKKIV